MTERQGTAIEWTHAAGFKGETWNPVTGCDRVSPGCAHCYAMTLAARLKAMGNPRYRVDGGRKSSGPGFGVTLHPDKLADPLRWPGECGGRGYSTAFFFKQWGGRTPKAGGRELDGRTWDEFPVPKAIEIGGVRG